MEGKGGVMTEIPKAAIDAAQDAYINGHISGDHFDALKAALQAAAPHWYDPNEFAYGAGFRDAIAAAAKLCDSDAYNWILSDSATAEAYYLAKRIRAITPQAKP